MMAMMLQVVFLACCVFVTIYASHGQQYLEARGTNLWLNNEKVFMSGMNLAWFDFGKDFGNGRYWCCTRPTLIRYLNEIRDAGGNSMRLWLHCAGANTPAFNNRGYVTATDTQGTLTADLTDFLYRAQERNILIFIVLWNGAERPYYRMNHMIWDDRKLDSYINNALVPMVRRLRNKRALGGWEIMNEPEGMIWAGINHPQDCFDTRRMRGSGMGRVNTYTPAKLMIRFLARQAAAIHRTDPKALVTIGAWSEKSQNDAFGDSKNFYTDACMKLAANGDSLAKIDVYQMHTYTWRGHYSTNSPFKGHVSRYKLDKPNVIGEFSQAGSERGNIIWNMYHAYYYGYNGAWTWHAVATGRHTDNLETQKRGLRWLRGRNVQAKGGRIDIKLSS